MKYQNKLGIYLLSYAMSLAAHAEETFDPQLEGRYLAHIQQLTFTQMGFEKAGEAYFSPDGESIIFQAMLHGKKQFQIFTMSLKDNAPVRVSTGKGACTCACYRPDGKKIIFASSHESPESDEQRDQQSSNNAQYIWDLTPYMNIYEANLDGSELIPLTSGPAYHAECAYSSDGSKIVYASNETGSMNIYMMQADGSDVRQLTHTEHCYNGGPFFSPDGKSILFRADRDLPHYLQLFLMRYDGSEEKQLTFDDAVNWAPYWHPGGKVVAYTTSVQGHRHYEIYLLDVLTGAHMRLTHNASFDGLPAFSPDGKKMLWTSKRSGNSSQIFVADFIMP
jgi:TolB protein